MTMSGGAELGRRKPSAVSYQFHIRAMLVAIALIALTLGLGRENRVVGIWITITGFPSLGWTMFMGARLQGKGQVFESRDWLILFESAVMASIVIEFLTLTVVMWVLGMLGRL